MRFIPQTFNDLLAVLLSVAIFGMWILAGLGALPNLPETVIGASIMLVTLIGQFYYRKRSGEGE
jgi:hypothetical protein